MILKFSAVLLSSVLASASFACDVTDPGALVAEQTTQAQVQISSKLIPDAFEGAGEYRSRRVAFESRLQLFQGQRLKVFTPEIFAGMLEEGIQIAELGLHIFEKLPTIFVQINSGLFNFESRIKSKNALISWRELVLLAAEYKKYPASYWEEFKFDIGNALQNSNLQPQVVAAHEYTLNQSERWNEIKNRAMWLNLEYDVISDYQDLIYRIGDVLDQLVEYKFREEHEDSIVAAVQKFRENLRATNKFVVLNDVYIFPTICPKDFDDHLESLLKKKISGEKICLDYLVDHIAIHRSIVAEYAQDPNSLSEWCSILESFQKIDSYIGIENNRPLMSRSVTLKEGVSHQNLVQMLRQELLSIVQTAIDKTFAWLVTQ